MSQRPYMVWADTFPVMFAPWLPPLKTYWEETEGDRSPPRWGSYVRRSVPRSRPVLLAEDAEALHDREGDASDGDETEQTQDGGLGRSHVAVGGGFRGLVDEDQNEGKGDDRAENSLSGTSGGVCHDVQELLAVDKCP